MVIRLANQRDIIQVAKLHYQEIDQSFLSILGQRFLSILYEAMLFSKNAFVIVVEHGGEIIAFASACADINKFYREFVRKNFLRVFWILLPKMFNILIIKKILETKKYTKQNNKNLPRAEWFSMAVSRNYQRRGIATQLFSVLCIEMKKRKIQRFRAIVSKKLEPITKFHKKMGAEFYSDIFVHQNSPSRIFIYTLENY